MEWSQSKWKQFLLPFSRARKPSALESARGTSKGAPLLSLHRIVFLRGTFPDEQWQKHLVYNEERTQKAEFPEVTPKILNFRMPQLLGISEVHPH